MVKEKKGKKRKTAKRTESSSNNCTNDFLTLCGYEHLPAELHIEGWRQLSTTRLHPERHGKLVLDIE